jgi:hypothetical protein
MTEPIQEVASQEIVNVALVFERMLDAQQGLPFQERRGIVRS